MINPEYCTKQLDTIISKAAKYTTEEKFKQEILPDLVNMFEIFCLQYFKLVKKLQSFKCNIEGEIIE